MCLECECTIAGYCKRHGIQKHIPWVQLCQRDEAYRSAWDAGKGPGQPQIDTPDTPKKAQARKQQALQKQSQIDLYHALWLELHTKKDATPAWFSDWCERVPSSGCGCKNWLADYLLANPPRYDDWFSYSVEVHNAVNTKLSRKEWTIEEATARWAVSFVE